MTFKNIKNLAIKNKIAKIFNKIAIGHWYADCDCNCESVCTCQCAEDCYCSHINHNKFDSPILNQIYWEESYKDDSFISLKNFKNCFKELKNEIYKEKENFLCEKKPTEVQIGLHSKKLSFLYYEDESYFHSPIKIKIYYYSDKFNFFLEWKELNLKTLNNKKIKKQILKKIGRSLSVLISYCLKKKNDSCSNHIVSHYEEQEIPALIELGKTIKKLKVNFWDDQNPSDPKNPKKTKEEWTQVYSLLKLSNKDIEEIESAYADFKDWIQSKKEEEAA